MSRATAEYVTLRATDLKTKSTAAFEIAIGKNPDKVRSMLNLWFVPEFKPTFYDENSRYSKDPSTSSSLDDIELLDPSYSSAIGEPGGRESRYPVRMIDLDTKTLVDYPEIGPQSQYCVLSHSWKGREVNYKYASDAKTRAFNRALAAADAGKSASDHTNPSTSTPNDIDVVKQQCRLDIAEREERIEKLAQDSHVLSELELSDISGVVELLLSWRVDVQVLEKGHDGRGGLQNAKRKVREALAVRDYERMEDEVFKQFLGDIGLDRDKIGEVVSEDKNGSTPKQSVVNIAKAEKALADEERKQLKDAKKAQFFERHSHIREAVEELIGCLQRNKSMVKIEQAIERSKEIFDNNPFQKTEKRYLWIDSCCINRADDGEYAKSISAMGEWYKNAEFCLVHLDTKRNVPKDALEDWQAMKSKIHPPQPNIKDYAEIATHEPEWSTRAWTLQELVMSKTTFYVNSAWELLSRPVEHLGPWYHLYPFVSLYTSLDTHNPYSSILEDMGSVTSLVEALEKSGAIRSPQHLETGEKAIGISQKLISILDILGLRIPRDVDMETARSQITQAVHVTVSGLTGPNQSTTSDVKQLLDSLLEALQPHLSSSRDYPLAERARHAINIVLQCLVNLIERPILDDRSYIAEFGKVPKLNLWRKGFARSRFSTQKVMSLVCGREATVMTDKAYCLMGMLGVRFPTFPAEGLTKALSRLLDEVVISSNDVSVFNWTGKQYGSPIRGRSLYPSSPEAYKFGEEEERKKHKDRKLNELLQIERYEVMADFLAISGMLTDAIKFTKDREQKNIPILWVKEILRATKRTKFEQLKPHIKNIGKILKYIEIAFNSNLEAANSPSASGIAAEAEKVVAKQSGSTSPSFSSITSQIKTPSLLRDTTSSKSSRFSRKKAETETAPPQPSSQSPSNRGIKGFKAPSFKGFGKDKPSSSQTSLTPSDTELSVNDKEPGSLPSTPIASPVVISEAPQNSLDSQVLSYIGSIRSFEGDKKDEDNKATSKPELPSELEKVLASITTREFSKPHMKSEDIDTMISPNPITVRNSGIEGLFDIQRVVVSMAQPEKLRRQIKNAVSPEQKISGWCIISTGFARVMVSFSCPKYILEKELDIVQTVETKILRGDGQEEDLNGGQEASGDEPTGTDHQGGSQTTSTAWQRTIKSRFEPPSETTEKDHEDSMEEPDFERIKEDGSRVSRMIRFVQESNFTEIAGEWTLARFSGVPGAKWFLCYLGLGGSGRDFYGHRIATDEIDFHNASPETGLMKYWEYYMMQKKYRLCSILQKLMDSKDWGNLKTEVGQSLVKKVTKEARVSSSGDDPEEIDSDDQDSDTDLSDTLKDLGGMAISVAGAGLVQDFYEWRAQRLQRSLTADVLRKFPTHLQAAMKSLDDNKDLMPSMFHSAKKVHMF